MKSALPKVLHEVCGVSMVEWVIRSLEAAGVEKIVVVVGHGSELVRDRLRHTGVEFVEQADRLGTGHAVKQAQGVIQQHQGLVIVSAADTPLLKAETVKLLIETCQLPGVSASLATAKLDEPGAYGRIIRDAAGNFLRIVEAKDCTPDESLVQEWNPALYCFRGDALLSALPRLGNSNANKEFYLPDALGILVADGDKVVTMAATEPGQFLGVNDRWQLAEVAALKQEEILKQLAESGVTIIDPRTTWIGPDVQISSDVTIFPNTIVSGRSIVSAGTKLGPNSWIKDSEIGAGCMVLMSHLDQAKMGDGSRCGPFANLRPGARLGYKAKIGNFVEIKNSTIGEQTSISHLTYIGDAEVGSDTNIGAGTITCNYDGFDKHRTVIGNRTFVGSNSTLVAPVIIGDDAMVAAGSTINRDVPDGDMSIGRGRQENKEGWFRIWRQSRLAGKSE